MRDVLSRHQQDWRDVIAAELRQATGPGQITDLDAELAAFQIDAVLIAANTAFRLGDGEAGGKIRRVIDGFLTPPR